MDLREVDYHFLRYRYLNLRHLNHQDYQVQSCELLRLHHQLK